MGRGATRSEEDGFTLIELLIVCTILPLIVGAISVALISVFSLQSNVSNRLSGSTDAQTVAANFQKDVGSAAKLTTITGPACGSSNSNYVQMLGLEWSLNQQNGTPTYLTVVSYVKVSNANGLSYTLVRQYCAFGPSINPTSTSVISGDVPATQVAPTISPAGDVATGAGLGWIPALGVTGVSFAITEPKSNYSYTLLAVPATSSSSGQVSTVALPNTSCNFATPGTGTYAATLCFADLSKYVQPPSGSCDPMTAALANFTLRFCVAVSPLGSVDSHSLPTYPEAFLGCGPPPLCNTGNTANFYTGIAGRPALYQTGAFNGALITVSITNIQVFGANGAPATGWQFVSGDAESTDKTEYITWTTIDPTTGSGPNMALIPNVAAAAGRSLADTETADIGNACGSYAGAGPSPQFPNAYLTGVGTPTVECMANGSQTRGNKTGTVMLEAPTPTSLTVTMKGNGLQAVFLGLLLPG